MKRSKFSLSHTKLLSMNQGSLIPIGLTEVLPGDTIQHNTNLLLRCSPLLAPVMHPIHVRIHHWFVPHRLVWDNWENFITGGPDGLDASVFPTMTFTNTFPAPGGKKNSTIGSLPDYLGVPTLKSGATGDFTVSALPFRAYQLIFNEWYRDQDLVTASTISTGDGDDTTTSTAIKQAAWQKDYFTTARPWTQKGPEVTIPLAATAPVETQTGASTVGWHAYKAGTNSAASTGNLTADNSNAGLIRDAQPTGVYLDPDGNLFTDLSDGGGTINELRTAFAIQRYEEARARYGSRYTEYLRYLGVKSSDARLQRPEYLGGGTQTIQFSEVLQTSNPGTDDESTDAVGSLKGHGIAAARSNRYRRFFEEHGYVITLVSVLPQTIYTDGLPRTWNRRTKEDFFQKELQHIGQQEILNKEIYAHDTPEGVFGYQDRYADYRQGFSSVSGEFRDTLDYWHSARMFTSLPVLNQSFISAVPTDRIFAAATTIADSLYVMARHSMQARRIVSNSSASFVL